MTPKISYFQNIAHLLFALWKVDQQNHIDCITFSNILWCPIFVLYIFKCSKGNTDYVISWFCQQSTLIVNFRWSKPGVQKWLFRHVHCPLKKSSHSQSTCGTGWALTMCNWVCPPLLSSVRFCSTSRSLSCTSSLSILLCASAVSLKKLSFTGWSLSGLSIRRVSLSSAQQVSASSSANTLSSLPLPTERRLPLCVYFRLQWLSLFPAMFVILTHFHL